MRGAVARGAWAPLLLAAVTAAFFWKIVFLGRAIGGLDVLEYFYPYRTYASQAIHAGRLPLWNPDVFGGVPFLANIQAGIFYPPTALFYALSFPAAYTWSVVLHAFLGALFTYLLARRSLHTARVPAVIGAVAFAFGGFLGGQMGHLNQLSAAIWLPALLLCWDLAVGRSPWWTLAGAGVVALQFLAGHTQESYLMLVALLLYAACTTLLDVRRRGPAAIMANSAITVVLLGLGAALAAVQLVPTSELTSWSIRANGLTYAEATTFSLKGTQLLTAMLPPFWNRALLLEPGGSEFLGYAGVTGLALALAALVYSRRRHTYIFFALAVIAFVLALGQQNPLYPELFRVVPGLNLFRVPARWLFLFGFSIAMLAALGAEAVLVARVKRRWQPLAAAAVVLGALGAATAHVENLPPISTRITWLAFGLVALAVIAAATRLTPRGGGPAIGGALAGLLAVELWLAAFSLDYNHPTAAELFGQSMGTLDFLHGQAGGFRALSVAQDTFAPAVEPEVRRRLGSTLGEQDLLAYLSYYKLREILEPNTSMAAGIPTIDGYDGGLLPLGRYVAFKDALTQRQSAPDDRIRFVVKWPPDRPLMDLAGVRYLVADSLNDKAIGGVSYDLSSFLHVDAAHAQANLELSQPHQTSSVGVVLAAKASGQPGDSVATLTLRDAGGQTADVPLRLAGDQAGQLTYSEPLPLYAVSAKLDAPLSVSSATLTLQPDGAGEVFLNGLALVDGASGASYSPLVAPGPEMTRVFQGDVKLYRNPAALAPAFLMHGGQLMDGADQAARAMAAGFDPARQAFLEVDPQPPPSRSLLGRITGKLRRSLPGQPPPFRTPEDWLQAPPLGAPDAVSIQEFQPERVVLRTDSSEAGFLVLTQSFYPGWEVTVDGVPAHLFAADVLFQAVHVPAGQHVVEFRFAPRSVMLGAGVSLAALLVCVLGLAGLVIARRRR